MALEERSLTLPPWVRDAPLLDNDLDRFTDWAVEQAADAGVDVEAVARSPLVDDLTGTETDPNGPYPQGVPETVRRWRITDDEAAEWAMAHVASVDVELESLAEQAAAWQKRIQAWFDHATAPLVAKRAFFTAHLERYALELRAADDNHKTLNLPSGKVKTTGSAAKAEMVDEATVLGWVRSALSEEAQAEVLRMKVLIGELRNHLTLTEVPLRVVLAPCGCVATLTASIDHKAGPAAFVAAWGVGSAVECPSCGDEALVGQWMDSYRVVTGPSGELVAGMTVAPESVTAKVVPS